MRILVVGAGGVGSAMVTAAASRDFFEALIISDVELDRARVAADHSADPRITATRLDASDAAAVAECARANRADWIVNACNPRFNVAIFDGAFHAGAHYLDMAMTLSTPHPERPYELPGGILGDYQFA